MKLLANRPTNGLEAITLWLEATIRLSRTVAIEANTSNASAVEASIRCRRAMRKVFEQNAEAEKRRKDSY